LSCLTALKYDTSGRISEPLRVVRHYFGVRRSSFPMSAVEGCARGRVVFPAQAAQLPNKALMRREPCQAFAGPKGTVPSVCLALWSLWQDDTWLPTGRCQMSLLSVSEPQLPPVVQPFRAISSAQAPAAPLPEIPCVSCGGRAGAISTGLIRPGRALRSRSMATAPSMEHVLTVCPKKAEGGGPGSITAGCQLCPCPAMTLGRLPSAWALVSLLVE
jgi:hypothetical protein